MTLLFGRSWHGSSQWSGGYAAALGLRDCGWLRLRLMRHGASVAVLYAVPSGRSVLEPFSGVEIHMEMDMDWKWMEIGCNL